MARREAPEINAGSMADIAFLLLIFFLVTTTIAVDKGITVKLPPWSDEPPPEMKLNSRNVYSVLVNANDDLLVRGEPMQIKDLRENTKIFIENPDGLANMAQSPNQAIISLKNDRGTSYNAYLEVYNELKAAYRELWDQESLRLYDVVYEQLESIDQEREVRKAFPLVISEAEPTSFGEE